MASNGKKTVFKFEGTISPVDIEANPPADVDMKVGDDYVKLSWNGDTIEASIRISEDSQLFSVIQRFASELGKK